MADYVNGKELFEELRVYHGKYKINKENGIERPPVTDTMAHAIVQIATRMSNSYNFVGYTYKDEMIADGILKSLSKIHLFDPLKSENVFAYVSQICWNAFINRITIEQNQSSVKARLIREKMSSEFVSHGVDADADDGSNAFVEFLKENDSYVDYNELRKEVATTSDTLKHRNKTAYVKKTVVAAEEIPVFDLSVFEEDETA